MLFFKKHDMSAAECLRKVMADNIQPPSKTSPQVSCNQNKIKSGREICEYSEILIDDEDETIQACQDPMACLLAWPESFIVKDGKKVTSQNRNFGRDKHNKMLCHCPEDT
jgi:hypothetical protein